MSEQPFGKLESGLQRIPGIRSVRVVGGDEPSEIHVIASRERSPKQLVRDVQSMAQAGYGVPIDHRIVSIVQLEEEAAAQQIEAAQTAAQAPSSRPVIDRVIQASKGDSGWVKVALQWPDGTMTEGDGASGSSRESRAYGALQAATRALEPALTAQEARVDVENLLIQRIGSADSVVMRVGFYERGTAATLVGSALVHDDVATAAVRALLNAINRKLR